MQTFKEYQLSQCYVKEYNGALIRYSPRGYTIEDEYGFSLSSKQYKTITQAKRVITLKKNKGQINE